MTQGDRGEGEARAERRRTITMVGGGAMVVLAVLAAGGALAPIPALVAAAAVAGVASVYGLAASAGEAERAARRLRAATTAPNASTVGRAAPHAAAMLEATPDPILLIGHGGRVEAANAAARRFFPVAASNPILSKVLRDPNVLEAVNAALAGSAPPTSVAFMSVTPVERFLEAFVAAVPSAGRGAPGAMVLLHDQTAVKRAERQRVDFLANASHELRTPLASLSGFIETLKGHARDDPEAREHFLTIMGAQAARMSRLIDDLSSLSRVEQNQHVPPTGLVDLAAVADDVSAALSPVADARGVAVHVDRRAPQALVVGDRDQMIQVVQNLVENAIKYTPRGGDVIVAVGAGAGARTAALGVGPLDGESTRLALVEPADMHGRFGWVQVRDSGPGIEPQFLPRLSERFYRVEEEETDAERDGTGLGLAIVKHIMSRHQGGFEVESAPGGGAAFTVFAPHGPDFADAPAAPSTGE